jgi:hypothetical protein
LIGNYASLSVLLTFLVVSLPPRHSFALVFFDIMITTIDMRRLVDYCTCARWRRRRGTVAIDLEFDHLDHVFK